jgi:peptidoglycan-associated lipoprotein
MTKTILVGLLAAMFVFTGCSTKEEQQPRTQPTNVSTPDTTPVNVTPAGQPTVQSTEALISALETDAGKVYFDYDKFNIRPDMQVVVNNNASLLNQESATQFGVKLEGNCDEWGTDEYNYALGLKRAKSVKNALVAQGVNAERIVMVSYGESNPTCKDKTNECWSKNRRVEVKVLP